MLLLGLLFTRYSAQKRSTSHDQNSLLPLISICSTLSFKLPFVLPFGKEKEADRTRKSYGQGLFSDHFLFAKVSNDFNTKRRSGRGELGPWLDKNFLSKKTLEMTEKMQQDLARHLKGLNINEASNFTAGTNSM